MAVPADEVASYLAVAGGPEADGLFLGLIRFRLSVPEGDEVTVTVSLSEAAPEGAKWFHYDPVQMEWLAFSDAYAAFGTDRKSVTLALEDGGRGDTDGVVNGTIQDPGGPGTAAAIAITISGADADTAASGGCFIEVLWQE
jgi:hypothetical protein